MESFGNATPPLVTSIEIQTMAAPDTRITLPLSIILIITMAFLTRYLRNALYAKKSEFPLINPPRSFEFFSWGQKFRFDSNSQQLIHEGLLKYKGMPFRVMTHSGEVIALPSGFAHSIRNEEGLSFMAAVADDFHARIPGFEPFSNALRKDRLGRDLVLKQLTKSLNKITLPLSEETAFAVDLNLGSSTEWHTITLYSSVLDIIARISSRVFLGSRVCRMQEWLDITKEYTVSVFIAAYTLRVFPYWMRDIIHWFHPQCRRMRERAARARNIIAPVIEERRRLREEAVNSGKDIPWFDDAIDWVEAVSNGAQYDAAVVQLSLSMAAIHTTSDLLTETLQRLARMPELVDELREEISRVLRAEGWRKTSLYNLKLLDSVVKETQRLKPMAMGLMERKAVADVKLFNGDVVPKGARTVCLIDGHRDSETYENPLEFDGHRFNKLRATEADHTAHLISTGPASLGFGHGRQACPGRFFAANEIKVALCHLLLKYDWKVPENASPEPKPWSYGFVLMVDHAAKVLVRKRANIDLDIDRILESGLEQ